MKKTLKQLSRLLANHGYVEVLTQNSGWCMIYTPGFDPGTGDHEDIVHNYLFCGEGATWEPREYPSLEFLLQEEGEDFLEIHFKRK